MIERELGRRDDVYDEQIAVTVRIGKAAINSILHLPRCEKACRPLVPSQSY